MAERENGSLTRFRLPLILIVAGAVLAGASEGLLGSCGPFTDVEVDAFCPFVQEIFYLGITTGTTPTTYDPAANVSRLQMSAFLSRSVDVALKRGSIRAALGQFWTTQNTAALAFTTLGCVPQGVTSDGSDVWVGCGAMVARVRGSTGKLLEMWTGTKNACGVLVAMGRVFVADFNFGGALYQIDPSEPAGAVTTIVSPFVNGGRCAIAFDGARIWTANENSVSIVSPGATIPWTVTTVTAGLGNPQGMLYDGENIWVADVDLPKLHRLDSSGSVLQTVTGVGGGIPDFPAFDGTNLWVPTAGFGVSGVAVVRASSGQVLQILTGNGLGLPYGAAFDGERIIVTSHFGNGISLWRASDLSPLGYFPTSPGLGQYGVCSDGVNFWIAMNNTDLLARF